MALLGRELRGPLVGGYLGSAEVGEEMGSTGDGEPCASDNLRVGQRLGIGCRDPQGLMTVTDLRKGLG